jgi:hypothetical protein
MILNNQINEICFNCSNECITVNYYNQKVLCEDCYFSEVGKTNFKDMIFKFKNPNTHILTIMQEEINEN